MTPSSVIVPLVALVTPGNIYIYKNIGKYFIVYILKYLCGKNVKYASLTASISLSHMGLIVVPKCMEF